MSKDGFLKFKRRFFIRTFTGYLAIIVLMFSLVYLFLQTAWRDFYLDQLKNHLVQLGQALTPGFTALYRAENLTELAAEVKNLDKTIKTRITLIAPTGQVIADSEKDPALMENHGDRPEVISALKGETGDITRLSSSIRERMLYLALPAVEGGQIQYIIRLSVHLRDIDRFLDDLRGHFATILLLLFLAVLLLAWYFSGRISKPVQEIVGATREFAAGNFNARVYSRKRDELGEVAESFNQMVEDQETLFRELNDSRQELQAIISSMKEGVLLLTADGQITLCNESFKALAHREKVVGSPYWEVLRMPGFEEFVKRSMSGGESFYEEIGLHDRTFLVGLTPLKEGDKLLAVFRDITGFKELEQMKRDFVVNLTHELKTPLTAIMGFVEMLEAEEAIKNTAYIDIIKRHTERMNQIVSDMLVLSELEEKNRTQVEFVPLDFAEMLGNILKIYREKISAKNLALELDIANDLPVFLGEIFKIEQMIINLVDNAVKYTEQGRIVIRVYGEKTDGTVNLQVKNTGPVIPGKSLGRLFERFYVVDKSRSRVLGGTGLGLSIVKHVVLLHQGKISVTSNATEGTVFTVSLPVQRS